MAQRTSGRPKKTPRKRSPASKHGSSFSEISTTRLTAKEKEALEEVMNGKAETTRYSGEGYVKKIRALLDE